LIGQSPSNFELPPVTDSLSKSLRLRKGDQKMITVLIAASSSILGEAIEKFLSCEDDLRVKLILIPPEVDLKFEIDRLQPDVVVIEDDVLTRVKLNMEDWGLDLSRLRLVTVSIHKNEVEIDQRYWVPITGLTDLLSLIRGGGGDLFAKR
jgi:hypothetical protein